MSRQKIPRHLKESRFLRNHQLSRREMFQLGAAGGGLALVGHLPPGPAVSVSAQAEIVGTELEVGVLYENPHPWFLHAKEIGDSLEADYPGTKIKYTNANTSTDPARALRWQNGDPLDVDFGRWGNQSPLTWDWADNGFLVDLSPYMHQTMDTGEVWEDTIAESAKSFAIDSREGTTTPGAWWGVPYDMVLMLIHYNVKALEEMGLEPPSTWEEFEAVCEAIDAKSDETGMKPICVSGPTDIYCGQWWDRMTQRVVGREAVEAAVYGDARLADNPGFLTAAQEIAKLPQNGWFMDGYEGADFTTAQALFFQGKAAMIHMGSWLSSEMKDVIPEDFELGVFDFPTYADGDGDQEAMFGTADVWSVPNPEVSSSHDVNVPLATEYIRRWTTKTAQERGARELSFIPSVIGVDPPANTVGLDAATVRSTTSQSIVYYYGIHWDTALWAAWFQPVQALFLNQIGPEEMIEKIDANLEEYRQLKG